MIPPSMTRTSAARPRHRRADVRRPRQVAQHRAGTARLGQDRALGAAGRATTPSAAQTARPTSRTSAGGPAGRSPRRAARRSRRTAPPGRRGPGMPPWAASRRPPSEPSGGVPFGAADCQVPADVRGHAAGGGAVSSQDRLGVADQDQLADVLGEQRPSPGRSRRSPPTIAARTRGAPNPSPSGPQGQGDRLGRGHRRVRVAGGDRDAVAVETSRPPRRDHRRVRRRARRSARPGGAAMLDAPRARRRPASAGGIVDMSARHPAEGDELPVDRPPRPGGTRVRLRTNGSIRRARTRADPSQSSGLKRASEASKSSEVLVVQRVDEEGEPPLVAVAGRRPAGRPGDRRRRTGPPAAPRPDRLEDPPVSPREKASRARSMAPRAAPRSPAGGSSAAARSG